MKIWVVGKRYQIFGVEILLSASEYDLVVLAFMRRPEWSWRRMLPFDVDLKTHEETNIFRIKPSGKQEENRSITWWGEASVAQKIDFPRGPIFSTIFKDLKDTFSIFLGKPSPEIPIFWLQFFQNVLLGSFESLESLGRKCIQQQPFLNPRFHPWFFPRSGAVRFASPAARGPQ